MKDLDVIVQFAIHWGWEIGSAITPNEEKKAKAMRSWNSEELCRIFTDWAKEYLEQNEIEDSEEFFDLKLEQLLAEDRTISAFGLDITKVHLRICDELVCENGYINAVYECWFDCEKCFGRTVRENEWFNLYTNWYPDGSVQIIVHIDSDTGCEELPFSLTEEEETFFRDKMEEACRKQCGMTLEEFYEFIVEEKDND